jgi:beta-glucosidase
MKRDVSINHFLVECAYYIGHTGRTLIRCIYVMRMYLLPALILSLIALQLQAQTALPGKVEAEAYTAMSGVQTENTADTGGGLNVGWIDANDWMDYSVNVQTAGNYTVSYRIASNIAAPSLQLKTSAATYTVNLPNTGAFQTWTTVSSTITFSAGVQTIRITALTNGFNFNWMQFASAGGTNVALNKVTTASSSEGIFVSASAVDGNTGTRWASNYTANEWIAIDLTQNYSITKVILNWEAASAKSFDVEVSANNTTWTSIYHTDTGAGGVQTLNLTGQGRYIRMRATVRNTAYGYSLWEFEVYGTPSTTNTPPVANAGADKIITLPTNSVIIAGTGSDANGDPITYSWTKISGGAATLTNAMTATLTASALVQGSYTFRLTVSDNKGGSTSDDVIVTVNPATTNTPPVANAGADKTITLPTNSVVLTGTGSDANGDPITYSWTKVSGGAATLANATTATLTASALVQGSYTFRLTVSDNKGASAFDDVIVTVNPQAAACTQIISTGKIATASSVLGGNTAAMAVDGNVNTRWESAYTDPQWITIDLGSVQSICKISLNWETASGKSYQIQTSTDNTTWTNIYTTTTGDGGLDDLTVTGNGRYVRMYGTGRNTGYGYSLWEFAVTQGQGTSTDTQAPTAPTNVTAAPAVFAVTINWTASTDNVGVASYRIYQGTTLLTTVQGTSTSMTISGLNPDTQYTYTVKAVDAADNESAGTNVTFRTQTNGTNNGAIGIGNIALQMPATASSFTATNTASLAVDGNISSRWESAFTDNEWITVDLGLKYQIGRVILNWEAASGKNYLIQVSDNNTAWTTIYEFNQSGLPVENRKDDLLVSGAGRYVRMQGKLRNSPWSYSLFEFQIYSPGSGPDDIPNPDPNPNPVPVPPGASTFNIASPGVDAMITDTRRPTLTWNASAGAVKYEVWLNITRTDYDWYALGNLLDRFTKMGEVTTTSYALQQDLTDRWTYKWYIVAVNGSGAKTYSTLGKFGLYIPVLEQQADGVNIVNGARDLNKNGAIEPYENWKLTPTARLNDLMSRMTIQEKAYQMFYNAQAFPLSGWAFGPGTVNDMFTKQKASATTRLGIPFVSSGDCIHGYSTTYPTQSTLAASRNLELVRQCGNVQREEQYAVGFRGTLAPLAEVGTKVLYPRIQEGGGEDAHFAAAQVKALVCGLQGGPELNPKSVIVTTKHWPGEGAGGEAGIVYDGVTIKYHMRPWFANIEANAGGIMPGYAGSSFLDPGGPGAGDSKKILDYLRNVVKFDGVITTDWLPWGAWVNAANAGSDVMGGADPGAVGFDMNTFISQVGETRINEAVKRILLVKFKLGVFEDPYGDPVNGPNTWFTADKVNVAIDAARQSMTMLKNNAMLPLNLPSGSNLLVTGSRANTGDSYSIWTSYFHDEYGAKTMFQSIQEKAATKGINATLNTAANPKAAIVIVGEPSYTHGTSWDKDQPYIHDAYYPISNTNEYDLTTLNNVKAMNIPYVVVVIMPRPYVLTDVVSSANAVLIAYRPGDGGGPALAQILFGEYPPKGKLPWQLPRSMDQVGTDDLSNAKERWDLPFDLGATAAQIQEIRSKIAAGEQLQPIYGDPLFQYGFGIQGYGSAREAIEENKTQENENVSVKRNPVRAYPNPSAQFVTVETDLKGKGEIQMQNAATGQTILIQSVENLQHPTRIDTNRLSSGLYILKVNSATGIMAITMMKE